MDQTYEAISAFLKSKPSHIFSEIISGVIHSSSSGHPVLIIDTESNLKIWTEAVKACFPEKVLDSRIFEELYLDKNGNKLLIIQPLVQDREELYANVFARTFDFKKNEFSSLGISFKYARLVEYGLLGSDDLLNSLRDLLSKFNYTCLDEDIDGFCELFLIISDENKENDVYTICKALDFINRYGSSDVIREIYESFYPYIQGIIQSPDKDHIKDAAVFAAKAFLSMDSNETVESACAMLCDCLDRLFLWDTGCTCGEAYELITNIMTSRKDIFYSFIINSGRLKTIDSIIKKSPDMDMAAFYMRIAAEALQILGISWQDAESLPYFSPFINSCSNIISRSTDGIAFVVKNLEGDIDAGMTIALLNKIDSKESMDKFVDIYVHKMDRLPSEEQESAREKLCSMGADRLIYEEFLVRLNAADNKEEIFDNWTNGILLKSEEFAQRYFSLVIMAYLKHFKSSEKLFEQCEKILKMLQGKEQYLDLVACQMLVNGMENGLSLDSAMSGKQQLIEYVGRLKKEFGIKTVPDMLFFAEFGMWLEAEGGGGYSLGTILEGMPSIMFLRGYRLRHFQDWCIPMLIPLVKTPEDHRRLVYAFRAGDDIHGFYQRYVKFLCNFLEQDKLNGYNVFLQFVVYFFYYLKGEYRQSDGKSSIHSAGEILREAIYSQPPIFRKRLDMDVRRELRSRRLKTPALWVEIIKQRPLVPRKGLKERIVDLLVKIIRKK